MFPWHTGDFNGDGRTDIFEVQQLAPLNAGKIHVTLSGVNDGNPVVFDIPTPVPVSEILKQDKSCYGCRPHRRYYIADFDGDGNDDYLTHAHLHNSDKEASAILYRSKGDGTFEHMWTFPDSEKVNGFCRYYFGDFNGDGRSDILVSPNGEAFKEVLELLKNWDIAKEIEGWESTGWKLFLSQGTSMHMAGWGNWPSIGERFHLGDFNGDGRTDFFATPDKKIWAYVHR